MKRSKILFSLFFVTLLASCFSYTDSRVFDNAQILAPAQEQALNSMIYMWENKTNHQMAVVTVKALNNRSIEDTATDTFKKLGIGSKQNDDGLLFLIAPNDGELRIEVGYGLEQYLPDGLVGEIRDTYVIPAFKKGDYPAGILAGTQALILYEAQKEGIALPDMGQTLPPLTAQPANTDAQDRMVGFLFFIIIAIILMKSKSARNILFWSMLGSSVLGGGRGRNDGFGGFGGGGFGGFGGGMSGGGGASGRW